MSDVPSSFTFASAKEDEHLEKFQWTRGAGATLQKHEIHMDPLDAVDFCKMIRHCKEFERKVLRQVATANQQGPSLCDVFGRTVSPALEAMWNQINAAADADAAVNNDRTAANFQARIREFHACHIAREDRSDLVKCLREVKKPREVPVDLFWHQWLEHNGMGP